MTTPTIDKFTLAYIVCALWSSTDDQGEPLDGYDVKDIVSYSLADIIETCNDFQESNAELLKQYYSRPYMNEASAGHDFWLTRNGHGAGFWDRGLGELGDKLTAAAKVYGECDVMLGDDGKLHFN